MSQYDGWWYVTTGNTSITLSAWVEVKDETIVTAPPIWEKFVGQPTHDLGDWYRSRDIAFQAKRVALTHVYCWGNNEKRQTLKGRPCRILVRGSLRSVLVEFEDGQREVVSIRALRKEN